MMSKHWTKKEELSLLQGIGANSLNWLCNKSGGRSPFALYHKLARIGYNSGLTRGTYTLRKLMDLTGYSESQLKRAAKSCFQKWRRTSSKGSFVITEDQMEELCAWLGKDFWSKRHKLYRCLWCNTQEEGHYGLGLCYGCYNEYYRLLRQLGGMNSIKHIKYFIISKYFSVKDMEIADKFINNSRAVPKDLLLKYIGLKQLAENCHEPKISFKRCSIRFNEGQD
jgi:hypothetical protein